MLYGLSGASGCGKTTLARRIAEDLDITFMPTSITESAKRHGYDPVAPMTLYNRIQLQHHLLSDHIEMVAQAGRPLLVDRTPIDMIAYMMTEFDMQSHQRATPEDLNAAAEFVNLCMECTVKLYDHVFLLGLLDHYEEAPTRPAANRSYSVHQQLIMRGAIATLDGQINWSYFPYTDPQLRYDHVHDLLVKRMDNLSKERASSAHIH